MARSRSATPSSPSAHPSPAPRLSSRKVGNLLAGRNARRASKGTLSAKGGNRSLPLRHRAAGERSRARKTEGSLRGDGDRPRRRRDSTIKARLSPLPRNRGSPGALGFDAPSSPALLLLLDRRVLRVLVLPLTVPAYRRSLDRLHSELLASLLREPRKTRIRQTTKTAVTPSEKG